MLTFNFKLLSVITDPATVVAVSEKVLVGESDVAQMWCKVEGNPLSGAHVTWKRDNYNIAAKTEVSFKNNTSYLIINHPTREDIGTFHCVANNGLSNQTSKDAYLIVKRKYKYCVNNYIVIFFFYCHI